MSDLHFVEVTLCTGCLFDVGNDCHVQHCDTYKALQAKRKRFATQQMKAFARQEEMRGRVER